MERSFADKQIDLTVPLSYMQFVDYSTKSQAKN
jgi:hypothetical protein